MLIPSIAGGRHCEERAFVLATKQSPHHEEIASSGWISIREERYSTTNLLLGTSVLRLWASRRTRALSHSRSGRSVLLAERVRTTLPSERGRSAHATSSFRFEQRRFPLAILAMTYDAGRGSMIEELTHEQICVTRVTCSCPKLA